ETKDRINASPSREGRITLPLNILRFPLSRPSTTRSSEPLDSQNADVGGTRPGYSRRLGLRMRGPAGGGWREWVRGRNQRCGSGLGWGGLLRFRGGRQAPF